MSWSLYLIKKKSALYPYSIKAKLLAERRIFQWPERLDSFPFIAFAFRALSLGLIRHTMVNQRQGDAVICLSDWGCVREVSTNLWQNIVGPGLVPLADAKNRKSVPEYSLGVFEGLAGMPKGRCA